MSVHTFGMDNTLTVAQLKLARRHMGDAADKFFCRAFHGHRTKAAADRCDDGTSGAATGSRLAKR
jgi:hypothetical protein